MRDPNSPSRLVRLGSSRTHPAKTAVAGQHPYNFHYLAEAIMACAKTGGHSPGIGETHADSPHWWGSVLVPIFITLVSVNAIILHPTVRTEIMDFDPLEPLKDTEDEEEVKRVIEVQRVTEEGVDFILNNYLTKEARGWLETNVGGLHWLCWVLEEAALLVFERNGTIIDRETVLEAARQVREDAIERFPFAYGIQGYHEDEGRSWITVATANDGTEDRQLAPAQFFQLAQSGILQLRAVEDTQAADQQTNADRQTNAAEADTSLADTPMPAASHEDNVVVVINPLYLVTLAGKDDDTN